MILYVRSKKEIKRFPRPFDTLLLAYTYTCTADSPGLVGVTSVRILYIVYLIMCAGKKGPLFLSDDGLLIFYYI